MSEAGKTAENGSGERATADRKSCIFGKSTGLHTAELATDAQMTINENGLEIGVATSLLRACHRASLVWPN